MTQQSAFFYKTLISSFSFEPTLLQNSFLQHFSNYIFDDSISKVFILKGYAGTGKTTLISTIVNNLYKIDTKFVLMAPTGRAAKVLSQYSGKEASTIHRKIYHSKKGKNGGFYFELKKNMFGNTIFFVDEASMIPHQTDELNAYKNRSLLTDLFEFVYSGKNCKLVLIGDTAQLPPINSKHSPALDADFIENKYNKNVIDIELTEVLRQETESGILYNATILRNLIADEFTDIYKIKKGFADIQRLNDSYEIQDALIKSYQKDGMEDTSVIVWSNKRANQYNQQIRNLILNKEGIISKGDFIMIVKNNYFWLDDTSEAGFIANGDIAEVIKVKQTIELYDFNFAKATIKLIDYPNQEAFDTILLLDTLQSNTPSLTFEESSKLFHEIAKDYTHLNTKLKVNQAIYENEYFNALQIKFSYAVTCHKSQGGQWKNIFIEKPYLPDGQNMDYWRWLYTALTRAQENILLIGYKNDDFEN